MKFSELAVYLEKLEKTASRIEITKILAELFGKTTPSEIDKTVYLLLGTLAPNYRGIVFNVAEKMMTRAVAEAYSLDDGAVKKLYKEKGDLGIAAELLAKKQKQAMKEGPTISDAYDELVAIAKDSGEDSVERKISRIAGLFTRADPLSARFIARIPLGKLRLGFSDKTVIDALSWMEAGDKSLRGQILKAYEVVPDIGLLAKRVKETGAVAASKNIRPVIGVPVLPTLAQRLKSPAEMIKKMGKVAVEPKFDGLRVQIHFSRSPKVVRAFTRNLNDMSEVFPELSDLENYLNASEAILDTEATGMDPEMINIMNFQTTMKRRRIHEVGATAGKIPLRFQIFDILLKDGKNLMQETYLERRKALEAVVKKNNLLIIDENRITDDAGVIDEEYKKNIAKGLEGVVVKKLDAPYVPGRTGFRWVKMKQEEASSGKLADTLDCIVMGYYSGRGKRTKFGVGGFLVGIKDGKTVKTVTKIGTGLTDEQFRELNERLQKLRIEEKPKEYGDVATSLVPDFWVVPKLVVEIAADDITKSPNHAAGLALRFPRLVRFRDDKSPGQATTSKELRELFDMQGN